MKIKNMTERITFYSVRSGIDPETHQPIENQPHEEFSVWAEVPKIPIREFVDKGSNVGFRKESPTFLIAFKTRKEIQSNWLVKWRGKIYRITSIDPDYKLYDLSKITTQEVTNDGSNRRS